MTALELGSLILSGEFALLAWGILFVMLRRQRQNKQADHVHAEAMQEELASSEQSRRGALETLFASTYKLEGEELAAKVEEYVDREKAFYNAMLSLFLERDGSRLKELPAELTKVLTPWAKLTPTGMIPASAVGDLEVEKSKLSNELESTKETLEQLMEEYTAAFARSHGKPEAAAAPPVSAPSAPPAAILGAETLEIGEDIDAWAALDEAVDAAPPAATAPQESRPRQDAAIPAPDETLESAFLADSTDMTHEIGVDVDPVPDYAADQAQDELEGLADLFETPPDKT